MSQEPGILAVWNDCDRTREAEYEKWYCHEHLPERVGVPGFCFGRRYEAIGGASPRFFTYYELDAPGILVSAPYLERSNDPTPWTRKIMGEEIFRNINRTACRQAWRIGTLRGAFALTVRWTDATAVDQASSRLRSLAAELIEKGIALRAEFWQGHAEGTGTRSVEQSLRSSADQSIAGALVIEATRDKDLAEASRALAASAGDSAVIGAYRFLCALDRRDMA
ncbi:MAG: hypothetical protein ACKVP3_16050 [Hyphomicrobiaceae bacterium]